MIVAVSDLHGFLPEVPACDLLIVAGDVTPLWDHSLDFQFGWLDTKFRQWLEEANAGSIVGIAGNHDFIFEKGDEVDTLELPWAYLLDSSYTHLGVKYYGLPWIPVLQSWAFYADDLRLDQKFKAIPDDTDVIISHGPPKGFCDRNLAYHPCGSLAATYAMRRVEPKAFICGHIHEAFGSRQDGPTTVYNVSYVDVDYQPQDRFTVIDLLESPDDALSEPGS